MPRSMPSKLRSKQQNSPDSVPPSAASSTGAATATRAVAASGKMSSPAPMPAPSVSSAQSKDAAVEKATSEPSGTRGSSSKATAKDDVAKDGLAKDGLAKDYLGKDGKLSEEQESPTLKASIYFKLSGGRTRNRTFPGDVNKHGRELLQEWSRQFRYGYSSSKPDSRKVLTSAKRNGTVSVDRAMAFGWFRRSQEKYSELFYHDEEDDTAIQITQLRNAGITDQNTIQALKVNRFISGRNRTIKRPPPGSSVVQFTPNEYHHTDQNTASILSDRNEFVEIAWESYKQFSSVPTTFFLMFGLTKVHVYTHESGRGSFFRASTVPPGEYFIDGHSFKVYPAAGDGTASSNKAVTAGTFHSSSTPALLDFAAPSPQVMPGLIGQAQMNNGVLNSIPNHMGLQPQGNPLTMAQYIISQMAGESPESRNIVMSMMAQDVATLKRLYFHYQGMKRQQQEIQKIFLKWHWRHGMSTNQPILSNMQSFLQTHMQPRMGPGLPGLPGHPQGIPQGIPQGLSTRIMQNLARMNPGLPSGISHGHTGLSIPRGLTTSMATSLVSNPLGRVGMPGGMAHHSDPQHMLPQKSQVHHMHQMHEMQHMQHMHQLRQMNDMRSRGAGCEVERKGCGGDKANSQPLLYHHAAPIVLKATTVTSGADTAPVAAPVSHGSDIGKLVESSNLSAPAVHSGPMGALNVAAKLMSNGAAGSNPTDGHAGAREEAVGTKRVRSAHKSKDNIEPPFKK